MHGQTTVRWVDGSTFRILICSHDYITSHLSFFTILGSKAYGQNTEAWVWVFAENYSTPVSDHPNE